jgi:hypothetical protein
MAITIVNLTLLKVSRKIDNLLSIYQANTRKIAWNYYDFRQKLLTYVLGKITNHYVAIEQKIYPQFPLNLFVVQPRNSSK